MGFPWNGYGEAFVLNHDSGWLVCAKPLSHDSAASVTLFCIPDVTLESANWLRDAINEKIDRDQSKGRGQP